MVPLQVQNGLNICWVDAERIRELVPGISEKGLRGGTFSPNDGTASPLLAINAFYCQAKKMGAEFRFKEPAITILTKNNAVVGVKTTKGTYRSQWVINAAGALAQNVAQMVGVDVPLVPESSDACITKPVQHFFAPLVVDIKPVYDQIWGNSNGCYFYQTGEGQIIFCLTSGPPLIGTNTQEISNFLPKIAKRLIHLIPRMKNIRVRSTWRGLFPATPDDNPIVGPVKQFDGFINAVGMGGHGYMIGSGLGEVLTRLVINKTTKRDEKVLKTFSLDRDLSKKTT